MNNKDRQRHCNKCRRLLNYRFFAFLVFSDTNFINPFTSYCNSRIVEAERGTGNTVLFGFPKRAANSTQNRIPIHTLFLRYNQITVYSSLNDSLVFYYFLHFQQLFKTPVD